MAIPRRLKDLCSPALLYFVVSILGLLLMFIQNMRNTNMLEVGSFSCRVPSTIMVFLAQLIYILFWTYVLNLICKDGYTILSWLLILLPFILFFVLMGLLMLNQF